MLSEKYPAEALVRLLVPRDQWQPYPTISDRAAWASLPDAMRAAYIKRGEEHLHFEWPALPADLFLQYARNGNRSNYQKPHFARRAALAHLVVAECMEDSGQFLDDIVNGIWAICEESYWGVPAHIGVQQVGNGLPDTAERTVDLFAAETSALLAWTHYLLGDRLDTVSPLVRPRIEREIDERILMPCEERDDFWWMGFDTSARGGRRVNNWNPWICSNWLASTLLLETDEARRVATVSKILRALDKFVDPYPQDGGCDEGPSYWGRAGASLFDNLDLLHNASGGKIDLYAEPLIQEIGRFIHRVHISDDYYINFADAPALVTPDAMLVYRYGQQIGDAEMMAFGRWLINHQGLTDDGTVSGSKQGGVPEGLTRLLPMIFELSNLSEHPKQSPLPVHSWLHEIEVLVARDKAGSAEGFFLAAKGGHNEESHNHNDIGNVVVCVDGKPLLVDAGVETYTAKTFDSKRRYTIWTMQSAYHTLLPTVDGVQQMPGPQYKATDVSTQIDDKQVRMMQDIAAAYPPEAKIQSWVRTVALHRGERVVIQDAYELTAAADRVTVGIVTPCAVDIATAGEIRLGERHILDGRLSGSGVLFYDADVMTPAVETIPITDERLGGTWGAELYRVVLTITDPAQVGVLSYEVKKGAF